MVRERAAHRGVQLGFEPGADAGTVVADELRLKQVLLNLLSNAVKFTPEGGSVTVRTGRDGDDLVVTVADTGVGIASDDQERIFDSFQQGGRAASQQEGTGLGLTLSKRIVELHGGSIWVTSRPGQGSTFGFRIPASPARPEPSAPQHAVGARTVLVVEDDQRSLDLLAAYLEGRFRILIARNGVEGLEALRRERPAAVVLDIRLPGIAGWDVLAAIKADPDTAGTPVVVASVLDERAKGLALGAHAYLVKPISRDGLLTALDDVLDIAPVGGAER